MFPLRNKLTFISKWLFNVCRHTCLWCWAQLTLILFIYPPLQDYGKESQAKDVIEEYFKSKKWSVNKTMKWSSGVCYWFELLGWILSIILLCTNLVAWLVHHFMSSFSKLKISDLFQIISDYLFIFNFEKALCPLDNIVTA